MTEWGGFARFMLFGIGRGGGGGGIVHKRLNQFVVVVL